MELHVVIRDTNVPVGSTAQPVHPVAAHRTTQAASVHSDFAAQEKNTWKVLYVLPGEDGKGEERMEMEKNKRTQRKK